MVTPGGISNINQLHVEVNLLKLCPGNHVNY